MKDIRITVDFYFNGIDDATAKRLDAAWSESREVLQNVDRAYLGTGYLGNSCDFRQLRSFDVVPAGTDFLSPTAKG